jgi:hypothetical protein
MTWVSAEYQAQHIAVYKAFGNAKDYACIDCDGPALDWSHEHDTDPWDVNNYWPRCRRHHLLYDSDAHRPTQETKDKIAETLLGFRHTEKAKRKMSMDRSGLSEKQVIKMRELHANGMRQSDIADVFNTSRMTVNRIIHGKTWQWVR